MRFRLLGPNNTGALNQLTTKLTLHRGGCDDYNEQFTKEY
jgi:hypothetical protein